MSKPMLWSLPVLTAFTVSNISRVRKQMLLKFTGVITAMPTLGDNPIFDSCTNVQFFKSLIDKTWRVFPFLIVNNHFWRRFNFFQNIF